MDSPHDQNKPRMENPAVEEQAFSLEDTGIASGEKIDKLLQTAITVREELQRSRRKLIGVFAAATVVLVLVLGFVGGVVWGLRKQSASLKEIAKINQQNGQIARKNSEAIVAFTGPEARERSARTVGQAIKDIGQTGICAAFYVVGEYPPACKEVVEIMDRIRAGENPYETP